ncbi:MAG: PKD domain-containing protein [Thermoproteota archaeon]|nr:PKD domain-containing protein [Thermoproteota archaeon]
MSRQPSTIEIITTAESTTDNFRLRVPQGWVIQDVNNTGAALVSEVLEGIGILAQLCPEQQQEASPNEGTNTSSSSSATISGDNSCRDAQEEVIHIVRYPNLGAKLGFDSEDIITNEDITTDAILAYQMQKLQEAGYRNLRIVDYTDTTINVDISAGLGGNDTTTATVPAKLVELTYSTNLDPTDTKTGYFIATATDTTTRNLGMITGYGIFYEGTSSFSQDSPLPSSTSIEEEEGEGEEAALTSISSILPPEPVGEVFDTFELIAGEEVAQAIAQDAILEDEFALIEGEGEIEGEEIASLLTVEVITNGTEGEAPATFIFEADAIGGTEPYTVIWDFDDDSVEESEEQIILHTYDEAGTYNVTVDIIDSEEQIASDSIEITVEETAAESEEEGEDGEETNELPTVEIVSNGVEGEAPATFEFEAEIAGGTEPYTISWDFGDGSEGSDEQTVEHTFDEAGSYNVDVNVTDSDGETASDSLEITVE